MLGAPRLNTVGRKIKNAPLTRTALFSVPGTVPLKTYRNSGRPERFNAAIASGASSSSAITVSPLTLERIPTNPVPSSLVSRPAFQTRSEKRNQVTKYLRQLFYKALGAEQDPL
jgi:hypothetical protein